MNAGRRNKFCGRSFTMEISSGLEASPAYRRQLQNPMAKLLNHKIRNGSGHKSLDSTAVNISAHKERLDTSDDKNDLKKLEEESPIDDASRPERYSEFSSETPVLKNRPAKRPARKMNIEILSTVLTCIFDAFLISMSSLESIKIMQDGHGL